MAGRTRGLFNFFFFLNHLKTFHSVFLLQRKFFTYLQQKKKKKNKKIKFSNFVIWFQFHHLVSFKFLFFLIGFLKMVFSF